VASDKKIEEMEGTNEVDPSGFCEEACVEMIIAYLRFRKRSEG
jgi:hypothetical protein